jgi:hypothetical protein
MITDAAGITLRGRASSSGLDWGEGKPKGCRHNVFVATQQIEHRLPGDSVCFNSIINHLSVSAPADNGCLLLVGAAQLVT